MKIPKKTKRYCPKCKKHTEHKIIMEKTKPKPKTKKRALKWGVRHYADVSSGYGGSPRPIIHSKAKTSRKANLKYECLTCHKKHFKQNPIRLKRIEQV